ncbi:PepSY domain-containing protein [Allopusillimonas soli]|uniref:PepSY domain-containing protein n=1 Tax=Allopusillimonas soli TaxID=659016 RepID=A0A853FEI9_9BURK|nr:PepSY-associated TM helix domain-containing protein [Allopusillimonas soli]NYT38108.1 PepSY domain-containing protein [Allopusillimonas soli]TEA73985.1 PepSY domain-containing protein [Allopusillimonas soli]
MTAAASLKTWYWVHKWSSLVCTLFLLVVCITGLPLVFHEEIDHWLDDAKPYAVVPEGTPRANVDGLIDQARTLYPKDVIDFVFMDDAQPQVLVGMSPSYQSDFDEAHFLKFDAHTGELLKDGPPQAQEKLSFMGIMLALHVDWFAGLPGELFIGFMGLLFVVAIVSGVVLYGPFMKKLSFGTVRATRSRRLKWLDLHNLLGIVTLAWAAVVGVTGVINELSTPLFALWQRTEVAALMAPYKNETPPAQPTSAQAAIDAANKAVPGNEVLSFNYPGNRFSTPHHYTMWSKGATPLTSHLFTPVLVDAATGEVTAVAEPPWYLKVLELSRPLHFGDYGGMPLKILWALLDILTIVVLASGLYLWFARRKATDARVARRVRELTPALES